MTASTRRTLGGIAAVACLSITMVWGGAPEEEDDLERPVQGMPSPVGEEGPGEMPAPGPHPPVIAALDLPDFPAPGKGRLLLAFDGNRRWCATQDDRLIKPLAPMPGRKPLRGPQAIFTFGYQMVIAAVRRGSADQPIMLFESPLYRTATWRPASKAGVIHKNQTTGPRVTDRQGRPQSTSRIGPETLVPYWHEVNRCATVAETMEFDLDPGLYDLYLAIDILNRDGGYVHRTHAFLLDVPVEAGRPTRVEGRVDMRGIGARDMELLTAVIEGDAAGRPAGDP